MISATLTCSQVVADAHEILQEADYGVESQGRLAQIATKVNELDTILANSTLIEMIGVNENPIETFRSTNYLSDPRCQNISHRSMSMWMIYKSARIILHQTRIQCLTKISTPIIQVSNNPVDESSIKSNIRSCDIIREMIDAIFSAVPALTGAFDKSTQTADVKGPKNIGGYYLLWPLHIIADCQFTSKQQKRIARDTLRYIGSAMGLNHAFEIARAVG